MAENRNIVVCSDGTGNRGGKTRGTNVWRIFNAVDRHGEKPRQITYYDDGVGTENLRWSRLFTGAFGWGLARNIREAYAFLAMNYEPCDKIFLFGFSRGAFTVRALAGLICKYGIPKRDLVTGPRKRREAVLRCILRAYRSTDGSRRQKARLAELKRLGAKPCCFRDAEVHFIGVWDTVDAVGLPFDELKRTISWLWSFTGNLLWNFRDYQLPTCVRHARQALALDDERKTYDPVLWEAPPVPKGRGAVEGEEPHGPEPGTDCESDSKSDCESDREKMQRVEQVWFSGAHANVGGGYPKDSLAFVSLDWMMGKATKCGLRFTECARKEVQRTGDAHGPVYNSRAGWGAFYRPALRDPYAEDCCPKVHVSVQERIDRGTNYYAPKVIRPEEYVVVGTDGPSPYQYEQRKSGEVDGG